MATKTFELGRCVATPGALEALENHGSFPIVYLRRHAAGDWGILSADDTAANEAALLDGSRILSCYHLGDGLPGSQRIWIITEAQDDDGVRASTCILLPSEY
jgi:hypothetical protein